MLNIEVQLCGFVFDLILIFFISRHECVGLKSEKIFRQCLVIFTACVFLDISSIVAVEYASALPAIVVEAVCKLYLVSLVTSTYFAFAYTYNTVFHLREHSTFKTVVLAMGIVGSVLILLTPIYYYNKNRTTYTYGPSVVITYIFSFIFILSTLITTFMLSIVVINRPKIDAAFDESFEASGSYTDCVMITTDKYRDEFSDILKKEYGIEPRKTASLLDTCSCIMQGIIPYGAQLLIAAGLSGLGAMQIIPFLFYPYMLAVCVAVSVMMDGKKEKA